MKSIKLIEDLNKILELDIIETMETDIDEQEVICHCTEPFAFQYSVYDCYYEAIDDNGIWLDFNRYKLKKGEKFIVIIGRYINRIGGVK